MNADIDIFLFSFVVVHLGCQTWLPGERSAAWHLSTSRTGDYFWTMSHTLKGNLSKTSKGSDNVSHMLLANCRPVWFLFIWLFMSFSPTHIRLPLQWDTENTLRSNKVLWEQDNCKFKNYAEHSCMMLVIIRGSTSVVIKSLMRFLIQVQAELFL